MHVEMNEMKLNISCKIIMRMLKIDFHWNFCYVTYKEELFPDNKIIPKTIRYTAMFIPEFDKMFAQLFL